VREPGFLKCLVMDQVTHAFGDWVANDSIDFFSLPGLMSPVNIS